MRLLISLVVAGGIASQASAQTVINVSSPAGLQSAINTAPDGAIIQLAAGTYAAPAGGFLITNPGTAFTIRAASGATVILDGQNLRNVLQFLNSSLSSGRPVTFERLTFANGFSATVAGGVYMSAARATFVDCVFQNNATSASGGGALIQGGSVVHFLRTTWMGNRAFRFGGGIAMRGAATEVTIHESQFVDNRTNLPGHSANSAGGAIYVANTDPGTIRLRVTSSRFEGNEASFVGGALYAIGSWQNPLSTPAADVIVANCLFLNNKAKRDPSAPVGGPTEGGAFHAENQTTARIYNSRFITNSADTGGAVNLYRADVLIEMCTFRGNRAVGTANSATGFGGAVSAISNDTGADGTNNRRSAQLTVRDSLFQGRYGGVTTVGQNGGCLYGAGDSNRLYGLNGASASGTAATNRASISISGSVFDDCDVVQTQANTGRGGAIFVDLVELNLSDSIIMSSDALPGSTNGAFTAGGGLAIIDQSSATISDSTIAKNTAGCFGGAILAQGTTVIVDGCNLVKNGVTGTSACGAGLGGTMFSGPIPGGGSIPDLPVSGEVRNSVITEGTGTAITIRDDDSTSNANQINTIVYNNNQIRNSNTLIYQHVFAGTHTVAGLNTLNVIRTAGGNTDKSPASNNTAPGANPVVGQIIAVPPNRLSSAAPGETPPTSTFLGYAWGGATNATLNGGLRSGNAGLDLATSDGLQTLLVSSTPFSTIVGTSAAPTATLVANPPGITAGGSAQLTWGVGGTFLETSIDQGVGRSVFSSGIATVTPAATTTYRHFASTEEGGAVAAATVTICSIIVVNPWGIPAATAASAYSQGFTQTGGSGAITWSLSGTLPSGLPFNPSTGALSGTPTVTGDFPITVMATDANGCSGNRGYTLTVGPAGLFEAVSLDVDAAGNAILEPGEVASLSPAWRKTTGATELLTGTLTAFSGPGAPDPDYSFLDGAASYGMVGTGAAAACASATGDCYSLMVSVPTSRPATHWDPLAREILSSGQIKDWSIHVGGSFDDVPKTNPFYPFIETLLHRSVTAGCSATTYCPTQATTRAQMAVFVLRAKEGSSYSPPACGGSPVFGDVPVSSPFCSWIEELALRGVVSGCGGGNYCPDTSVTRAQMAVFVLRTLDSGANPPACTTPIFGDVPASNPFCRWIEELERRGVVAGCGGGNYCPTSSVTRQQMGVFIGVGFDLSLYGP